MVLTLLCAPHSGLVTTAAEQQPVVFASLEKGVAAHAKIESVQFEIKRSLFKNRESAMAN